MSDISTEKQMDYKPWLWTPPADSALGKRRLRPKEGPEKVSGRGLFVSDIVRPGMLYAKFMHSPHANARIVSMDTNAAKTVPGVRAVIRYDDTDVDLSVPPQPPTGIFSTWWEPQWLTDRAHWAGQAVGALVVADTEHACDQALRLIKTEWEVLPFVLDADKAAETDAPILYPGINSENNLLKDSFITLGDVEAAFPQCDYIIEYDELKREPDVWGNVESGAFMCELNGDNLECWYHGQFPAQEYTNMLPFVDYMSQIIIHSSNSGGTFGGNAMAYPARLNKAAAVAAKKLNRPVKVLDEGGYGFDGVGYNTGIAHYKVGFNSDGTVLALDFTTNGKGGFNFTDKLRQTTKVPNFRYHNLNYYRNQAPAQCWKDGGPNSTVVTLMLNKVAAELEMDPTEVWLKNDGAEGYDMAWVNENVKAANGMQPTDSLRNCIEVGKNAFGWDSKWHAPGTKILSNGKYHGIGFTALNQWASRPGTNIQVGLSLRPDGSALLMLHRCDNGQSAPTSYCQLVSAELGVPYDKVYMNYKEHTAFDCETPSGSYGTGSNSPGIVLVARKLKERILTYALQPVPNSMFASNLPPSPSVFEGRDISELDIKDGVIFEKSNPDNTLTLSKLASGWTDPTSFTGSAGPFFEWIFAPTAEVKGELGNVEISRQCYFVEVEVDPETGAIDITNQVVVNDVGQVFNPDVCNAQQYGGVYQGTGVSRQEAIYYDPTTGVKLNDNLLGYPYNTIGDIGNIELHLLENHLGFSAYGALGIGENPKACNESLLVPAIYNAIGKWIIECPLTPNKILKALGKA